MPDEKTVLFDRSINDAYNAPGSPVYEMTPDGRQTIVQDGDAIFLSGQGATPTGNRPFLRRLHLATGETDEIWRCGDDGYEAFVAFLPNGDLFTTRQSPTEPANFYQRQEIGRAHV